jgi:trehalose-6-phosphatase
MISPRFTKGSVVRALLAEIDPATPVAYLGDDEPDEDAFLALDHRGLRILVRSEWRETLADTWLRPPGELLQFLSAWLEACGGAQ